VTLGKLLASDTVYRETDWVSYRRETPCSLRQTVEELPAWDTLYLVTDWGDVPERDTL
jgi:hypothetical protein